MLRLIEDKVNRLRVYNKPKIFCIGRNKTGTTSLKKAFQELKYVVGNQREAEKLLPDYRNDNFESIIKYCRKAQVFQDFPFSYPNTYRHLDLAYPGSKFILTVRDSPEQWYKSLINFHAKLFGNGSLPTKKDLQRADYVWKGWMWESNRIIYKTPKNDPYQKDQLIKSYENYNASVLNYFKKRDGDFIVINLSEQDSYQKLMIFLNIDSPYSLFPWENKTEKLKEKK